MATALEKRAAIGGYAEIKGAVESAVVSQSVTVTVDDQTAVVGWHAAATDYGADVVFLK